MKRLWSIETLDVKEDEDGKMSKNKRNWKFPSQSRVILRSKAIPILSTVCERMSLDQEIPIFYLQKLFSLMITFIPTELKEEKIEKLN